AAQVAAVGFAAFVGNAVNGHQLAVVFVNEAVIQIQHIGEATGHTGTEVVAGFTQYHDHAAGHVFAAVVAGAFHNGDGTRVTHGETLTGTARRQQLAAGGTVQTGVADNGGVVGFEYRTFGRVNHQLAAGHAFTHVIVGVTFQHHFQTAGVPHTERLTRHAGQFQAYRVGSHTLVAVTTGNFTRQTGTNGAVAVGDAIAEFATGFLFNGRQNIAHHAFRQYTRVVGMVALNLYGVRFIRRNVVVGQQRHQVKVTLFVSQAVDHFQQVGTADQLFQRAYAQLRHPLPGFFGNEMKHVFHHVGGADVVFLTQVITLSGHAGGAVIQVADTQVLTTHGHHRQGTETEGFGPEDGGFHHVQTGFQTTVGLHPHFAAQIIGAQRLMRFRQAQLPRRARILDGRDRRRRGTTVITGNGDQVGVGLRHTSGNGAHTRLGDQFHRYQRLRVYLLQVENQLRQIFDGVDIVVRRR